jgi:hypothetical protein
MNDKKALDVLKIFYYGCKNMTELTSRAKVTKIEATQILKNARECQLIAYSTKYYGEVFEEVRKDKLGVYLRKHNIIN